MDSQKAGEHVLTRINMIDVKIIKPIYNFKAAE